MRQRTEFAIKERKDKHFRLPLSIHKELTEICKIDKRSLQDEIDFLVSERKKTLGL
jgi:hypothetical protein